MHYQNGFCLKVILIARKSRLQIDDRSVNIKHQNKFALDKEVCLSADEHGECSLKTFICQSRRIFQTTEFF